MIEWLRHGMQLSETTSWLPVPGTRDTDIKINYMGALLENYTAMHKM